MTPVQALLLVHGWGGTSAQRVLVVGLTPKRFRIRAMTRTKLAGRNRWLEPGKETLVPTTAIRITSDGPFPASSPDKEGA